MGGGGGGGGGEGGGWVGGGLELLNSFSESKSKKHSFFVLGWGATRGRSEFCFFTKNPNLFFFWGGGGGEGELEARVSDFFH